MTALDMVYENGTSVNEGLGDKEKWEWGQAGVNELTNHELTNGRERFFSNIIGF